MLSKLNTLLVKVEGVMNALIKIMYMVMNNQYLICPPLLIRLMVGELNLLRTVNIFRSLEPIPYLRKGQDIKKATSAILLHPMAKGICSDPTRERDTQVKKLEQRKYIGWVHSHSQIRFYKTNFLETD